jgi:hypothetical protein
MERKTGEMTVKEFLEEAKRLGAFEVVADPDFGLLHVLRREGFTEEQANEMKMEKAWKFYLDSISMVFDQMMGKLSVGLEKNPLAALTVLPQVEQLKDQLEESVKKLEEEEKRRKKREG